MKLFIQAALVSAIALSGSAYAMQAMDDSALSSTTGQDGITVLIALPGGVLNIDQVAIFDGNGFAAGTGYPGAAEAGAIVLGKNGNAAGAAAGAAPTAGTGLSINTGGGSIGLIIDASGGGAAGAGTGTAPVLNINVKLPATLNITTGDISVAGATLSAGTYKVDANTTTGKGAVKILNSMTLQLGGATMNIQLGNPNQGAMIVAGGTITGGLGITNLGVVDNATLNAGTLNVAQFTLTSNGSANLALAATIDVTNTAGLTAAGFTNPNGSAVTAGGLVIGMGTLTAGGNYATGTYVAGSAKYDAYMQGVTLGDAASTLGDVRVTGLDLTGVKIAIQGH
jgi:hypothetical protein